MVKELEVLASQLILPIPKVWTIEKPSQTGGIALFCFTGGEGDSIFPGVGQADGKTG